MDNLDSQIIAALRKDAKMPFNKIAQLLGVGTVTDFRRFKKLHALGIIGTPTIILGSQECGFEGMVDFLIKMKLGVDATRAISEISHLENVYLTAQTMGDHDLYC